MAFSFRALVVALAACSPVLAQRLIALNQTTVAPYTSSIQSVDMQSGVRTMIAAIGAAGVSLAYDSGRGRMYMGGSALYTIDIETGTTTQIGAFSPGIYLRLEYDSGSDVLYGVGNNGLYRIDTTTGVETRVGVTGLAGVVNLCHDSIHNVLYAMNWTSQFTTQTLWTLNPANGAATLVGSVSGTPSGQLWPDDLAFRGDTDTMYLVHLSQLYSVNLATRVATAIGAAPGTGFTVGLALVLPPANEGLARIYLPPGRQVVEGSTSTSYPFGSSQSRRVMYAYGGSTIEYAKPIFLSAIELRPEGGSGIPVPGYYNFSLDCSTGAPTLSPSALNPVFDNNHGSDRVRVFNGSMNVNAPTLGQTPNAFALRIPFARPFEWDPRCGPLVLDFVYNNGTPVISAWDAVGAPYAVGGCFANSSTATSATTMLAGAPVLKLVRPGGSLWTPNSQQSQPLPFYDPAENRQLYVFYRSTLPWTGRRNITTIALRHPRGSSFPSVWPEATYQVRITMSSINAYPGYQPHEHGFDSAIVYEGALVTPWSLAGSNPDHVDLVIELQRPFSFDTVASDHLLVEINHLAPPTGPGATPAMGLMDCVLTHWTGSAYSTRTMRLRQGGCINGTYCWEGGLDSSFVMSFGIGSPTVTIPATLATTTNTVGASGSGSPFHSGQCRALNMISAADAGITTPTFVRHLRFRPPGSVLAVDPTTYTCTIDLSNPTNTPPTISTTFDNNHGPNRTRVFDGQFSVPYITRAVTDTEFPCQVKLQRPFLWDPAVSPYLSVDFRILSVAGPGFHVETTATLTGLSNARVTATGNANATTGNVGQVAIAMQFGGEESNGISTPYGAGCLGTNGVPRSTTRGLCTLPNPDFGIGVRNARGLAPAFLVIGFGQQSVPLAGAPGCNLLTTLEVGTWGLVLTDIAGVGTMPFPFPNENAFHGVTFNTQWLVYDPAANALGLAASDALRHQLAFF